VIAMSTIQRILVAVDFGDTSNHALDWALDLASKLGAEVTLVHAYELPVYGFPEGALVVTADVATRLASGAQAALSSLVQARSHAGAKLRSILKQGVPWEEINAAADEIDADLIVLGTHGRKGFSRALLGSVAERVIRTSTRPVVTVRLPAAPKK
jgi:nucleotide-binding universal stress UspA family protein